jgi:hypothetical protein
MRTARFVSKTAIVGPSDSHIVGPSDYGRIVGPSDSRRLGQVDYANVADKAITVFTVGVIAIWVAGLAYMAYDGRSYNKR